MGLCWVLFQLGQSLAARTLVIFSLTVVALLLTAIMVGGTVAMWCVVTIGLFTSIGWSNTFSLALEGTGNYKSQVSSMLVMAILGGAVLPPLQGKIADLIDHAYAAGAAGGTLPWFVQMLGGRPGIQFAFVVPMLAYAYDAFYGWKGHKIGRPATE